MRSNRLLPPSVFTTLQFSLSGVHRTLWFRWFLIAAILLPILGFISQDIHVADHPLVLFMDFQYGLQRYLLLLLGLVSLHSLWIHEENIGTASALKAAGIRPLEHMMGKHIGIACLVGCFQFALTTYTWLLSRLWTLGQDLPSEIIQNAHASAANLFAYAWANTLMVLVVAFFARLIWITSSQQLLGFAAGATLVLAGFTKPIWVPYFHSDHLIWIFRFFGKALDWIIPSLWQFDLWIMREDFIIHSMFLHLLKITLFAMFWLFLIHLASWRVTQFKRT